MCMLTTIKRIKFSHKISHNEVLLKLKAVLKKLGCHWSTVDWLPVMEPA